MERVEIGTCVLYRGDCLELLPTLESGSVSAVVTDPPYGEVTHAGARTRVLTGKNYDAEYCGSKALVPYPPFSDGQFLSCCREFVRLARRWVVMTCDWRHAAAAETSGLPVVRVGVWVKPDAAPQFSGDRPAVGWEAVLLLHRTGRKRWNGGGHQAVWTFGVDRERLHPNQKPGTLISEWLRLFTDPGDTVLDPFLGSGTTAVACVQTGRRCVGIEIDKRYFDVACKRVERAVADANPPLFAQALHEPADLFAEGQ